MSTCGYYIVQNSATIGMKVCSGDKKQLPHSYALFGWLADVRNLSAVGPLVPPRGGPEGMSFSDWEGFENHPATWYTLNELLNVDYSQMVEDCRLDFRVNGSLTCPKGEGKTMFLGEFLPEEWFTLLEKWKNQKVTRILFWFE